MTEASEKSKEYQEYEHLNYHVKWLGKNYKLGDPTHRWVVDSDLEAFASEEHNGAGAEGHTQPVREIQETIIRLTDGNMKDQDGTTLRDYLEYSWKVAVNSYNAKYAANRVKSGLGYMEGDFSLDPKGRINPNRSSDLDIFAQEYLRNV
ncbi:hypothetical protein FBEOM_5025 [Fusarium beomiforme]|uniref:Uncharacterized protein n=1 Tax=Fusarium beomiforme TaxID=44412 RepID=A0A9P5DZH1_9HYPO|nr:hypothetical protein FBEOM_5025 [Fusarium beomiforme]